MEVCGCEREMYMRTLLSGGDCFCCCCFCCCCCCCCSANRGSNYQNQRAKHQLAQHTAVTRYRTFCIMLCIVLYCIVLYCIVLYCVVLYYVLLCCFLTLPRC